MFEVRRFSNAQQPVHHSPVVGDNPVTLPPRREASMTPDVFVGGETNSVGATYPTVGEYVKQQFSEKLDGALSGLHMVAEAMPPVLLAEIGAIHLKHRKQALQEIWNLPMDPQGKWKAKAEAIMDRHAQLASQEVRKLPLIDTVSHLTDHVGHGLAWVGNQIKAGAQAIVDGVSSGLTSAGRALKEGANYVVDGFVSTGVAIGQGVERAGVAIQTGSRAAGKAIKHAGTVLAQGVSDAYDTTVSGIRWVGTQAVEVPKAAARGVIRQIGEAGQDMVDFSRRTEPIFAPAH